MQRKVSVLSVASALLVLSSLIYADEGPTSNSIPPANASLSANGDANANPGPAPTPVPGTMLTAKDDAGPSAGPFKVDPKSRPENQVPTSTQLESGRVNYQRYCADCHGKEGEGKMGPKLVGSLMVTGPTYGHIIVVLSGHPQSKMPTWGISEVSDEVIAGIVTYQRNAWGNCNKKEYGKNAGGVVTPAQIREYRKTLKNLPLKQDVRT